MPAANGVDSNSNLSKALAAMHSSNARGHRQAMAMVLNRTGLAPHSIHDVLHDTDANVVPGVSASVYQESDPAKVRYAGAWHGLLAKQDAVLMFRHDPAGEDSLYRLRVPGKPEPVRKQLTAAGVASRVLVPKGKHTQVVVHDPGRQLRQRVGEMAANLGVRVEEVPGTGTVLGGRDAAEARRAYRDVIREFEGGGKPAAKMSRKGRPIKFSATPDDIRGLVREIDNGEPTLVHHAALADALMENGYPLGEKVNEHYIRHGLDPREAGDEAVSYRDVLKASRAIGRPFSEKRPSKAHLFTNQDKNGVSHLLHVYDLVSPQGDHKVAVSHNIVCGDGKGDCAEYLFSMTPKEAKEYLKRCAASGHFSDDESSQVNEMINHLKFTRRLLKRSGVLSKPSKDGPPTERMARKGKPRKYAPEPFDWDAPTNVVPRTPIPIDPPTRIAGVAPKPGIEFGTPPDTLPGGRKPNIAGKWWADADRPKQQADTLDALEKQGSHLAVIMRAAMDLDAQGLGHRVLNYSRALREQDPDAVTHQYDGGGPVRRFSLSVRPMRNPFDGTPLYHVAHEGAFDRHSGFVGYEDALELAKRLPTSSGREKDLRRNLVTQIVRHAASLRPRKMSRKGRPIKFSAGDVKGLLNFANDHVGDPGVPFHAAFADALMENNYPLGHKINEHHLKAIHEGAHPLMGNLVSNFYTPKRVSDSNNPSFQAYRVTESDDRLRQRRRDYYDLADRVKQLFPWGHFQPSTDFLDKNEILHSIHFNNHRIHGDGSISVKMSHVMGSLDKPCCAYYSFDMPIHEVVEYLQAHHELLPNNPTGDSDRHSLSRLIDNAIQDQDYLKAHHAASGSTPPERMSRSGKPRKMARPPSDHPLHDHTDLY